MIRIASGTFIFLQIIVSIRRELNNPVFRMPFYGVFVGLAFSALAAVLEVLIIKWLRANVIGEVK